MRILLVEDEEPKQRHIENFLHRTLKAPTITLARSVRGALASLKQEIPDVVILDMSLPTFEIGGEEAGGRPQGFGGIEVIRNMDLDDIVAPVVFLTGYEAFTKAGGQLSLDVLAEEIRDDHPELFHGIIHFNSAYGDWQARLRATLESLGGELA